MPKTVTPVTNMPCIIASTLKPIIATLNPMPIANKTKGTYLSFIFSKPFKNDPSIYIKLVLVSKHFQLYNS